MQAARDASVPAQTELHKWCTNFKEVVQYCKEHDYDSTDYCEAMVEGRLSDAYPAEFFDKGDTRRGEEITHLILEFLSRNEKIGTLTVGDIFTHGPTHTDIYSIGYNTDTDDYLFDGVPYQLSDAKQIFWLDNYGHARFGMEFINDLAEDHAKHKNRQTIPYRRLVGAYNSCGETLSLKFDPV